MFYALIPQKPKGGCHWPRQVVVNKSTAQIREKKATREVYEQIFRRQYRTVWHRDPTILRVPFCTKKMARHTPLFPRGCYRNIQKSPLFDKMKKDCQAEGVEIPQTIMVKDPVAHMLTPQEYLQKVADGLMPQMDNHQMMKELAEKNDQMKILMMEFWDIEPPKHKLVT